MWQNAKEAGTMTIKSVFEILVKAFLERSITVSS